MMTWGEKKKKKRKKKERKKGTTTVPSLEHASFHFLMSDYDHACLRPFFCLVQYHIYESNSPAVLSRLCCELGVLNGPTTNFRRYALHLGCVRLHSVLFMPILSFYSIIFSYLLFLAFLDSVVDNVLRCVA